MTFGISSAFCRRDCVPSFFSSRSQSYGLLCLFFLFFQTLDVEGIYRGLFALRETKLVLDLEVMPTPADLQPPSNQLQTTRSSRRRDVGGAPGLQKRGIGAFEDTSTRNPRSSRSAGQEVLRGGNRGTSNRVDDVAAMATPARSGGGRPKRPSERQVLAEMTVDPDLPLPLPTFHGMFLEGVAQQQPRNKVIGRNSNQQRRFPAGSRTDDPTPASIGGGGTTAVENYHHGYFVPGVVAPRQRQSHSLPQELRAISTTPTPERRLPSSNGGAGTTGGTGKRHRVRSRSGSAPTSRGTSPAPPPRPPASAAAVAALEKHGGKAVSTPRPEPGSAAALASAREQRRYTSRAVDELRQEMREREGRLERELDRLRQSRSQRTAPANATPAVDSEPAAKAAPAATVGGNRVAVLASRGRRRKGRPLSRPLASKVNPAASFKVAGEEKGDEGGDDKITPPVAPSPTVKTTADAQAQTALDGMQLYFQPQPTVRDALRTIEEENRQTIPSTISLPSASNAKGQQTERWADGGGGSKGNYLDDSSFSSSSVSEGGGDLGRNQLCPRQVSPPPPVVFIEGEGRNTSWRPSDDDQLLQRGGGGGAGAGDSDTLREAPDGGDGGRVLTVTGEGGDDGGGGNKSEGVAEPREIRVTTGRLQSAGSGSETGSEGLGARVQDEVWVQLASMLALSTSEQTAGQTKAGDTAAAEAPASDAAAFHPVEQAPTVSPELLDLMREVVGQQKGIGEERSALMQVCRNRHVWRCGGKVDFVCYFVYFGVFF